MPAAFAPPIETTAFTPAMLDLAGLLDLYRVWDAARTARGSLPHRRDIDVLALGAYLGDVSLLDVVDGGRDFRYRVQGTRIAALLGADHTGRLISDGPRSPGAKARVIGRLRQVAADGQPLYGCTAPLDGGAVAFTHRLLLPISGEDEGVGMILLGRRSGPAVGPAPAYL